MRNVLLQPRDGEIQVAWQPPANTGGSAITKYTVRLEPGAFEARVGPSQKFTTIAGLTNGDAYTATVTASNAAGDSTPTEAGPTTPAGVPDAPTDVALEMGDGIVTVRVNGEGLGASVSSPPHSRCFYTPPDYMEGAREQPWRTSNELPCACTTRWRCV